VRNSKSNFCEVVKFESQPHDYDIFNLLFVETFKTTKTLLDRT
jgi:hypothetical protein